MYGDGMQVRDWLHVEDHCRAIDLILHSPEKFNLFGRAAPQPEDLPIFDISARQAVTNRRIVELILSALGGKDFGSWVEHVTDRPNHDRKYVINPAKIERVLGFSPTVSFEEGIASTVRWYAANESWWRDILKNAPALQIDWKTAKVAGLSIY